MGLCSGLTAAGVKPKVTVECELCTMVLKYVDAILSSNASEVGCGGSALGLVWRRG